MPDSNVNFRINERAEEKGLYLQKKSIFSQISKFLFQQGLIDLREKKRFDELVKKE